MEEILVLGGSYFIGKTMLNKIYQTYPGSNITVLNRGNKQITNDWCKHIIADRNNDQAITNLLEGKKYDVIFDISGTEEKQIKNIVEAIMPNNIGLYVFLSSSAVYSDKCAIPFKEESLLGENSVWGTYGENKIECEKYITEIHNKSKMNYIIVRPPYVYGEWNYIYRESYCFKRADENNTIIVPGDGNQKIQFIHVEDLCNSIIALVKNKASYNEKYNVGKETVTFKQWVKMCINATNKEVPIKCFDYTKLNLKSRDFFPFHDYNNVLESEKINEFYTPQINMQEALYNCYNWYKKNKEYIDYRKYEEVEEKILKTCQ